MTKRYGAVRSPRARNVCTFSLKPFTHEACAARPHITYSCTPPRRIPPDALLLLVVGLDALYGHGHGVLYRQVPTACAALNRRQRRRHRRQRWRCRRQRHQRRRHERRRRRRRRPPPSGSTPLPSGLPSSAQTFFAVVSATTAEALEGAKSGCTTWFATRRATRMSVTR
jgi:hypothetical protein